MRRRAGSSEPRGWRETSPGFYRRYGKRVFDLMAGAIVMLLLLPVILVVALLVRVCLGSPVLFRQVRPGLHGVPFTLIKFRTMGNAHDRDGRLLPDAERLTTVGRILRATSLDELPEFWNVLAGDMSLVGPRPLLMAYLERYTPRQALRHSLRPGLTGLAQVSGRNGLTWEDKFDLDVEYVRGCSLWLDLRVLLLTVSVVLLQRGISQPGHVTAEEFLGTGRPDLQPSPRRENASITAV